MTKNAPVGILDSGFGGLSVARAVREVLPAEDIIFAADCGFAPWGDRDPAFIDRRVHTIVDFLLQQNIKALVLACNTATAVCVDKLRKELNMPVIGIEPAVFPGVRETKTGIVGVLATVRTIASTRYQVLKTHALQWAASHRSMPVAILDQPCPGLMNCVEKGAFETPETVALLERYVTPLLKKGADRLVLGCTHYPFLKHAIKQTIEKSVGNQALCNIELIDPAPAVARQLARTLTADSIAADSQKSDPQIRFFATGVNKLRESVLQALWSADAKLEMLEN